MTDQRSTNPKQSPLFQRPEEPARHSPPAKERHQDEKAPDQRDVEPGSDADASDEALGV